MGDPAEYKSLSLNLKKGARMTQKECIRALVHLQYERSHNEFLPGNFRVRGDIIEIFPVSGLDAFRVELFGGSISALERVSCDVSGKTAIHGEELPELSLFPAKHFVMPREKLLLALRAIETELALHLKNLRSTQKIIEADRLERRTQYDLETLREFGYCSGIENYSRHLSFRNAGEAPYTLLNYFPRDFLVFIDESHMTIPQLSAMYLGDRARKEVLVQYGFRLPSALDNRPLQFSEFEKRVLNTIYVSATPGPYEIRKSMAAAEKGSGIVEQLLRPTGLLDPEIEIHPSAGQIEHLATKLRACIAKGQRALVLTLTKRLAEDVAEYLTSRGIKTAYLHSEIPTLMRPRIIQDLCAGTYDVIVGINLLREGIDLQEVALVAILDADKEGFLRNDVTLIQMMGRAARHLEGKVLLYADRITTSLKGAIKETERRRAHQRAYNAKHGITPKTIERRIRELPLWLQDKQSFRPQSIFKQRLPLSLPDSAEAQKRVLEREMRRAARDLEFEYAIYIRDLLKELEKSGKVQSS